MAAVWPAAAVSQVEGRAALALRSRPLAPIDIIGARRGRPGCSRGWRAAGPVREPGSGAEEEEVAEEKKKKKQEKEKKKEEEEEEGGERQPGGRERRARD